MIIEQSDYLANSFSLADAEAIRKVRRQRQANYLDDKLEPYRAQLRMLQDLQDVRPSIIRLDLPAITIGQADDIDDDFRDKLSAILREFMPWKKGPFVLFGISIDAEWRSDVKWQRVAERVGSLRGLRIADIGCNNGYFMFRMAADSPEIVVGFEPYAKNLMEFEIFQYYARVPNLYFELLGAEHLDLYAGYFDLVFCMGILYHQTDPIEALRRIYRSLRPGGQVIIDCQGIPGEESVALLPAGRYAQARGIWYLPTLPCLLNWLRRTQFRDIECFYNELLTPDEQRTTPWAPVKSLVDFLDPMDSSKTIEGYPAPRRFYVIARR